MRTQSTASLIPALDRPLDPGSELRAAVDSGVGALLGHRAGMTHRIRDGQMPEGLGATRAALPGQGDEALANSARAPSHSSRTISAAGLAWAIAADWPAQTCMRCTSPAF